MRRGLFAIFLAVYHFAPLLASTIRTYAGDGIRVYSGDMKLATSASISGPAQLFIDSASNFLYFAESTGNRVRRVALDTNIIETFAGGSSDTNSAGKSGVQATKVSLANPSGVWGNTNGAVYVSDTNFHTVRIVAVNGVITPYAGTNGSKGFAGDDSFATSAMLAYPMSLSGDTLGNLYIVDSQNYRIRIVNSSQAGFPITTVAGSTAGFQDSDALTAQFDTIVGIYYDISENRLLIADSGNNRIRCFYPRYNNVSTIAGTSAAGNSGDNGLAIHATLNRPYDVHVDPLGSIYIADTSNNVIRIITKNNGIIRRYAGQGDAGFSGDGSDQLFALMNTPAYIVKGPNNRLYISDVGNSRIRLVSDDSSTPTAAPTLSLPPSQAPFHPSVMPSLSPLPSQGPSSTRVPSCQPSCPSAQPTSLPSSPSSLPSAHPSFNPVSHPTPRPSSQPTSQPTSKPSNMPSSNPTYQPAAKPTRIPFACPSLQPTGEPSKQPSVCPSAIPTIRPSRPTLSPTNCPIGEFLSVDTCILCPNNSVTDTSSFQTCTCNLGFSSTGTGVTLQCTPCAPGTIGSSSSTCVPCAAGSFNVEMASTVCTLCPLNTYSGTPGGIDCTSCPSGRITPTVGASSLAFCLSPAPNFAAGTISLAAVAFIVVFYVARGRYSVIAYARKRFILLPMVESLRLQSLYMFPNYSTLYEIKWMMPRAKIFLFSCGGMLSVIIFVALDYVGFMYYVFINSMIIWRGYNLNLQFIDRFEKAIAVIGYFLSMPNLVKNIFYPIPIIFRYLGQISINLGSLNVTCQGSQASVSLLVNVLIFGLVVIFIESDYQVFWSLTLSSLHQSVITKVFGNWSCANQPFRKTSIMALVLIVSFCMNPFQIFLRYVVGFVNFRSFVQNNGALHPVSATCDHIAGVPYIDSIVGYVSSGFAWWMLLPLLYMGSSVFIPGCYSLVETRLAARTVCRRQLQVVTTTTTTTTSTAIGDSTFRLTGNHGTGNHTGSGLILDLTESSMSPQDTGTDIKTRSNTDNTSSRKSLSSLSTSKRQQQLHVPCQEQATTSSNNINSVEIINKTHGRRSSRSSPSDIETTVSSVKTSNYVKKVQKYLSKSKLRLLTLLSPDMIFAWFARHWIRFLYKQSAEPEDSIRCAAVYSLTDDQSLSVRSGGPFAQRDKPVALSSSAQFIATHHLLQGSLLFNDEEKTDSSKKMSRKERSFMTNQLIFGGMYQPSNRALEVDVSQYDNVLPITEATEMRDFTLAAAEGDGLSGAEEGTSANISKHEERLHGNLELQHQSTLVAGYDQKTFSDNVKIESDAKKFHKKSFYDKLISFSSIAESVENDDDEAAEFDGDLLSASSYTRPNNSFALKGKGTTSPNIVLGCISEKTAADAENSIENNADNCNEQEVFSNNQRIAEIGQEKGFALSSPYSSQEVISTSLKASVSDKATKKLDDQFPFYFELCYLEYMEIQQPFTNVLSCALWMCSERSVGFLCKVLSWIAVYGLGLGHFCTVVGYEHWKIVLWKYFLFVSVCCGIWSNDDIALEAFHIVPMNDIYSIHEGYIAYDSYCGVRDCNRMSTLLAAVVGTRAILLMLFYNSTLASVFFLLIAGSPLFVFSEKLREKLNPLWIDNAMELAFQKEKQLFDWIETETSFFASASPSGPPDELFNIGYRALRIKLRAIHIQWVDSRFMSFVVSGYTFLLATVLLFSDDPYWYIISSLVLRGLYALVVAIKLVLNFGTYLQLKNSDFDYNIFGLHAFYASLLQCCCNSGCVGHIWSSYDRVETAAVAPEAMMQAALPRRDEEEEELAHAPYQVVLNNNNNDNGGGDGGTTPVSDV